MNFKDIKRRRRLYEEPSIDVGERVFMSELELRQWLRDHPYVGSFVPGKCCYNQDGDCFEVDWKDVACYAEGCGDVTLMKSLETDEVVGVRIWDVRRKSGLMEVPIKEPKETPEEGT